MRNLGRGIAALMALVLVAVATPALGQLEPTVAIGTIGGQAVGTDGRIASPLDVADLTVTGTSDLGETDPDPDPGLIADAGDSVFVERGKSVPLVGLAHGGESPFTFAWSVGGSSAGFADPTLESPTLDTSGLPLGRVQVDLTVTDGTQATDTDSVQLYLYELAEQVLIDTTQQVEEGAPDELIEGGAVDGQSKSFPFSIVPDSQSLRLSLSWADYESVDDPDGAPLVGVNDFDLYVNDPSDEHDENTDGAGAGMPEIIEIDQPAVGDWQARVDAFLNSAGSYRLEVSTVSPPNNPLPRLTTDGPFRFEASQAQTLTAGVVGGTTPYLVAWDLDLDGEFETQGANATAALPLGNHLVTAKVTDAAGFEHRETTAVRVVSDGSGEGNSAVVVVGVSDTGINPYHRDFSASTFPNPDILALTDNFTRHPSEYIEGYPADMPALPITLGEGYRPVQDAPLFTKANLPLGKDVWIPGTKIVGAVDTSDVQPINGEPDNIPLLDEDGHGTASASTAVGNVFGFCPSCVLVFGEGFSSDAYMYEQSWIDITSNSFGSAANVGFAGLIEASQPLASANAGQLALYAAGNGNENAFVTPQQTYTSENLGADWIVRVGAVVRSSRKPIIGTGKPVDVSSFGSGTIPAAGINTVEGTTNHSGTSAATPLTSGVFGDVLRRVRGVLGDRDTGPRGQGVLATGRSVAGSAYLGDGILTRAELEEAVLKTTEHDTTGTTSVYPTTTPYNDAQYVIEGYGVAEPASGERAFQVLMGAQPLPARPDEDEFFAADSMLRDAIWGSWNKGGNNSAAGEATQGASTPVNPFAGVSAAAITDLDSAMSLLQGAFDLWPERSLEAGDVTVAGPQTYWLHYTGPCDGSAADKVFMDLENSDGDFDGCGGVGLASVAGSAVEQWTSTVVNGASIPAGTPVTGSIFLQTAEPAPVTLTATLNSNTGLAAGSAMSNEILSFGLADGVISFWNEMKFAFTTTRTIAAGETLTLAASIDTSVSWFFGYEGDHASGFTIAAGGDETDPTELAATIDAPAEGTVVDPDLTPVVTASGRYSFGDVAPAAATATTTRHYPRRDTCTAATANMRLTQVDGTDPLDCGFIAGASVYSKVLDIRQDFPLVADELPITLGGGKVSGIVYAKGEGPSPVARLRMELSSLIGASATVIGSQSVQKTLIGFPLETHVAFPFEFEVPTSIAGTVLDDLTFSIVWEEAQGSSFIELDGDGSTTFVDIPLAGETLPTEGTVEVSVDNFASVTPAALSPDGTWALDVPVSGLADGGHTISVRARSATGETSVPDAVGIVIDRVETEPTQPTVQVQYVPMGTAPAIDGWVTATDTSAEGDFSSWSHTFAGFGTSKKGTYEMHARLLDGSSVLASTVSTFCKRQCKERRAAK